MIREPRGEAAGRAGTSTIRRHKAIVVTSAQVAAAKLKVKRAQESGRPVSAAVRAIANAKPKHRLRGSSFVQTGEAGRVPVSFKGETSLR